MIKWIWTISYCLIILSGYSQSFQWNKQSFLLTNTKHRVVDIKGEVVLQLERDLKSLPFDPNNLEATVDLPTFAKKTMVDLRNAVIEVKLMSRIMDPSPFQAARGFIGIAFRIDSSNHFDCIYLRPANGRTNDTLRRKRAIQYFSFPNYSFSRLRKEAGGAYETEADIGLDEWIDVKLEIIENRATLYLNGKLTPAFTVSNLLGNTTKGKVGLWVDVGTIGYFKSLRITPLP